MAFNPIEDNGPTYKCGQCRQFTRNAQGIDTCGAWEQPTTATRVACDFFMFTVAKRDKVEKPNGI